MGDKIVANVHWMIILYAIYSIYIVYGEHLEQVESLSSQIPALETKIVQIKQRQKDIEKFSKDIEDSKKKVEIVASQVEELTKRLPNEINEALVLETFSGIASQVNLKKITFETGAEVQKEFLYAKSFGFKGSSTFLQLLVFLENLANEERIYNVYKMTIERETGKTKGRFQRVTFNGSAEAYRFNPSYQEDRGFDKIENRMEKNSEVKTPPASKNAGDE